MHNNKHTKLNREMFLQDPFGYSALASHKLKTAKIIAGNPIDITKPTTIEDLNSEILWFTQAYALTEAAKTVLRVEPDCQPMGNEILRSICDSQYCAVGLMLVAYSLEVVLKAIAILIKNRNSNNNTEKTKNNEHHKLIELANFIPNLNDKDKAILKGLTHYSLWAGRYPSPKASREKENDLEKIFNLSEKYKISAYDLFNLSSRVMKYAEKIITEYS